MSNKMRIIFGTMEMGRRLSEQESRIALERFFEAGYTELDTARSYSRGETENILGRMPSFHSFTKKFVATKVNPWVKDGFTFNSVVAQFSESLSSLQVPYVDLLYLHAPDHETPLEETLSACEKLHKEGKFKELGLSNYSAELVRKVFSICNERGWIKPTVYQGMYNAITRDIEKDLFPTIREFGLRMYIYNPLAGGLLAGKYKYEDLQNEPLGRFFGNEHAGKYRERYWKKQNFDALEHVKSELSRVYSDGSVNLTAASLLWALHHSLLDASKGDGIIIGASTIQQLDENLTACNKPPLHPDIIKAFDLAWESVKETCPPYYR